MRTLLLLRHAKSSWADPALSDRDRPLAPRGWRATEMIANHMRREGIAPELVLCSTARRTRETLEGISGALGEGIAVEFDERIYEASEETLLDLVRAVDDAVGSVLLIAHNPGIEGLALELASPGRGDEHLAELRRKYPTGGLATLQLGGSWSDLGEEAAALAAFATPKGIARSG